MKLRVISTLMLLASCLGAPELGAAAPKPDDLDWELKSRCASPTASRRRSLSPDSRNSMRKGSRSMREQIDNRDRDRQTRPQAGNMTSAFNRIIFAAPTPATSPEPQVEAESLIALLERVAADRQKQQAIDENRTAELAAMFTSASLKSDTAADKDDPQ